MICHVEQLRRCDKQPRTCLAIQDNTALFASPDAAGVVVEPELTFLLTSEQGDVVFCVDTEGRTQGDIDEALSLLHAAHVPNDPDEITRWKAMRAYLLAIKRARQERTPRQGEDDE